MEPRVLLGVEAERFATEMSGIGRDIKDKKPAVNAEVVVVLFEPGGLVRLVLIDTVAERKAWSLITAEEFILLLSRLGDAA